MKKFTETEIKTKVQDILKLRIEGWKEEYSWKTYDVEVKRNDSDHVLFEATKMYDCDAVEVGDSLLEEFRQLFDAKNVEKFEDIAWGGCPTCDYGSTYGFAIRLWD